MATSKSMNRVFLLSLIHYIYYFGVLFSVLHELYGLINLYVIYRKRNIDLLVSYFALKRNLGDDYMSRAGPVSRAGSVYRDGYSALYYMRRASPPAAKFRSCRVKRWLHQRA